MKLFRLLAVLFFALQIFSAQPKNILFVGDSYLYYNNSVHNYVEPMLREFYGSEIETKLSAIGGSKLYHHNIDHLLNPENLNLNQQIDVLIMQGGSTEVISATNQKKFVQTVKEYSAKAQKLGVKTALYMTMRLQKLIADSNQISSERLPKLIMQQEKKATQLLFQWVWPMKLRTRKEEILSFIMLMERTQANLEHT